MFNKLREYKFSYVVFNFFNKKKLKHNIPLFKKFAITKKYYSSISSRDFSKVENEFVRQENLSNLLQSEFFQSQNPENQESLKNFYEEGYSVIKGFLNEKTVDSINNEIQNLQDKGTLKFRYVNKLMFAIHHSELLKKIGTDKKLLDCLSILMDGKAKLFQSINFITGSEQKTHSDSIHMTTFPLGGLVGVWIALEDVDASNGALHYYPKSHKLPYYLNSNYDNEGTKWKLGDKGYMAYEDMLQNKVVDLNLKKTIFNAKKGDMLIWHANILHGGEKHLDTNKTRKSMVYHYFDENSICYHEITQRPALF